MAEVSTGPARFHRWHLFPSFGAVFSTPRGCDRSFSSPSAPHGADGPATGHAPRVRPPRSGSPSGDRSSWASEISRTSRRSPCSPRGGRAARSRWCVPRGGLIPRRAGPRETDRAAGGGPGGGSTAPRRSRSPGPPSLPLRRTCQFLHRDAPRRPGAGEALIPWAFSTARRGPVDQRKIATLAR